MAQKYSNGQVHTLLRQLLPDAIDLSHGKIDAALEAEGKTGGKTLISSPIYFDPVRNNVPIIDQLGTLLESIRDTAVPPKQVLIPIRLGDNDASAHWVALHIAPDAMDRMKADLTYVNSFGYISQDDSAIVKKVESLFPRGDNYINNKRFQYDAHSCGPITVETLEMLAHSDAALIKTSIESGAYANTWQHSRHTDVIRQRHENLRAASAQHSPAANPSQLTSQPPPDLVVQANETVGASANAAEGTAKATERTAKNTAKTGEAATERAEGLLGKLFRNSRNQLSLTKITAAGIGVIATGGMMLYLIDKNQERKRHHDRDRQGQLSL